MVHLVKSYNFEKNPFFFFFFQQCFLTLSKPLYACQFFPSYTEMDFVEFNEILYIILFFIFSYNL